MICPWRCPRGDLSHSDPLASHPPDLPSVKGWSGLCELGGGGKATVMVITSNSILTGVSLVEGTVRPKAQRKESYTRSGVKEEADVYVGHSCQETQWHFPFSPSQILLSETNASVHNLCSRMFQTCLLYVSLLCTKSSMELSPGSYPLWPPRV